MQIERFDKTQPEDVAARCEGAQIIVNKEMPLTKETIAQLPDSVKLICEAGTGYNNVDLEACSKKGVCLSNVPTYATEAMAHMAITSLMACSCSLWQQAAASTRHSRELAARRRRWCRWGEVVRLAAAEGARRRG